MAKSQHFAPCSKNYELDWKMIAPFMMGTTSSTIMQTSGQINRRSPAAGAMIWCLYVFFTYRTARKHETAGIKFIQEAENQSAFSPRRGDSLHRFTWNLAWPTGTRVRLADQNFISIGACGPKSGKFPFLVRIRPAAMLLFLFLPQGRILWPISESVSGFYMPDDPALVFF